MDGSFYLVSVPIGNLDDITIRAKKILEAVDVIISEDTRQTGQLLSLLNLPKKQLYSYREQNHDRVFPEVVTLVKSGKSVALVADRGTPTISDPGFKLVRDLYTQGISVTPVPGVSSVITALTISGLPTDRFTFLGFLSRKTTEQKKLISKFIDLNTTIVFFESPFRLFKTLKNIRELLKGKTVSLAHELTKMHESVVRGNVDDVLVYLKENKIKGEWVVLIR